MHEVERRLFDIYKDPNLYSKPEELNKRGGAYYSDTACECISAIVNNKRTQMVVSTQNNGALPCLETESIVEVSCIISARGAEPIAWGKMPPAQKGWLQLMKAMEECTIEAALRGDYGMALEAFTLNPLIQSGAEAKTVLDELLVAHEKYLPQFADKIKELKEKGIGSKDKIVMDLMAAER
jgi:6-phospho-beta-glucosidase